MCIGHGIRVARAFVTFVKGRLKCLLLLLLFDPESGARVMCDVGYLCANCNLPRPLCLDLGPMYATDRRQTSDVRRASSLNAPYPMGADIKTMLTSGTVI